MRELGQDFRAQVSSKGMHMVKEYIQKTKSVIELHTGAAHIKTSFRPVRRDVKCCAYLQTTSMLNLYVSNITYTRGQRSKHDGSLRSSLCNKTGNFSGQKSGFIT